MKTLLTLAVVLTGAIAAPAARAAHYTLDLNLASIHTEHWARKQLNQRNEGLGITAQLAPSWSVSTGFYRNSYRRTSVYALAAWTPLHIPLGAWHIDVGGEAGLVSGYLRNEVASSPLMAAGLVRLVSPWHWAIALSMVPNAPNRSSGFIGAQLSLPL